MKKAWVLALFLGLGGCQESSSEAEPYIMAYHREGSQYMVVVVQEGLSTQAAHEAALKAAAKVAKEYGYQYFTIESQQQVVVFKGGGSQGESPQNIYYTLIQSPTMEPEPTQSPVQQLPGYQLKFTCFQQKPSGSNVYEVSALTSSISKPSN